MSPRSTPYDRPSANPSSHITRNVSSTPPLSSLLLLRFLSFFKLKSLFEGRKFLYKKVVVHYAKPR